MFDILFNPDKAERHPLEIILVGMFYSAISVLMGLWVFKKSASLPIVFLTVLSCLYIVQSAFKMEEKKEKNWNSEFQTLKDHKPLVKMILCLFLGFTITFSLFSMFLPPENSLVIFNMQQNSVEHIKAITGNAINLNSSFSKIFSNNINIVLISLIFAIFYGAGVIYILAWNASVMGFVIGTLARETFGLVALPIAFLKYFIHGIPEMMAYILSAIAGGIIYFAFIKGDMTKKNRVKRILIDAGSLILISIFLLIIAAILEVFVSPLI
jgi:stage II sporulation protein M